MIRERFIGVAIAIMFAALAGCAGGVQPGATTVPAQAAYIAVNVFNGLETAASAYDGACAAGTLPSACKQTVKLIDAPVRIGKVDKNQVLSIIEQSCGVPAVSGATSLATCPPIPITAYQALEGVITTLQSTYTQYNIALPSAS